MLGPSAPSFHVFPLSSEERVRECLWSGVASVVHLSASTGALCSASTHLSFPLLSSLSRWALLYLLLLRRASPSTLASPRKSEINEK
ncbi:unnamed protein product [Arctogadus glacialis]